MIAQIVLATVLGATTAGASTDPLESALDYVEQMEITAEASEVQAEAEALERQQAIDRASRESDRQPTITQSQSSGSLPPLLLTIRSNESGGNYSAYNASGCEGYGCGGAYQLHANYASGWASEAGYPNMSSQAQNWPPDIQDAVALYKFNATNGGLWCDWADYC